MLYYGNNGEARAIRDLTEAADSIVASSPLVAAAALAEAGERATALAKLIRAEEGQ
ncbi:hypothetical protein ACWCYY_18225 [Kitasatospora sp. NPDC001664]